MIDGDEPAEADPKLPRPDPPIDPDSAEILAMVNAWAEAWSKQRVEDYLAFYASSFVPPGGMSRAAWEAERRQRLLAPGWIAVAAALVDLRTPAPNRAEVEFIQSYKSDGYTDVVVKTLELVVEAGRWTIARETSH